jgi:hypothetical protein
VAAWDEILASGRRLPGRGGSDAHHTEPGQGEVASVGNPTTWVLADDRSPEAVLAALDAGRITLSYDPAAERIELRADADGDGDFEAAIGDNLEPVDGPLPLRVDISGFRLGEQYQLIVYRNGEVWRETTTDQPQTVIVDEDGPGSRAYYRAEVRGEIAYQPASLALLYQDLIGYTNAIYVGYDD